MKHYIIIICICIILTIFNLFLIKNQSDCQKREEIVIVNKNVTYKDKYNKKTTYYNKAKFNTINKIFKEKKVYTIAITNNKSNTQESFKEYINKLCFYNNENIYLINISEYTKKEKAKYYNLNPELKNIKENTIIKIYNKKIISKTTLDKDNINKLIKSYE